MEGLQISPSSKELLSEPAVIQACTPFEHDGNIKERLSRIPSTKSSFRALPLSPESEPGNLSLTITTATTATDPTPEGSTAATSVLSLPEIFVVQKFYVSPSMQMDERIRVVWLQRIRARLDAVLFVSVQCRGSYVQEFMMVGKRQDNLKSALVIWCDNAAIKKKVWQTFKSQGWLQELLKANEIMFVALVSKAHLSAGPASKDDWTVELNQAYAVQLLPSRVTTSCGLSLLVSDTNKRCTLGGLLVVSGKIVGLTAGHPFPRAEKNLILPGVLEEAQAVEDLSDRESSTICSEPFVFNDDDCSEGDDSVASTMPLYDDTNVSSTSTAEPLDMQHEISASKPSLEWNIPQAAILPTPASRQISTVHPPLYDHDWALLKMLPQAVISQPNKVAHIHSRHDILIETTVSGPVSGEVTISIASIGPQLGNLHPSPASLRVDESILDVQLIVLERVLPLGSSGAWVILGNELCGYIVAIRQDIPWAYMVAIEPILADIRRRFKTDDVRLPTAVEVRILTASFSGSELEILNDVEEETPDGYQVNLLGESSNSPWETASSLPISRHPLGIPSTTDRYLPNELVEGPVAENTHRTVEQKNKSLDEKPFLHDMLKTSLHEPSAPPRELPCENAHNNKSFGPFCSDTSSLHDLPDPPSPTVSHSSHTEKFTTRSIDAQDQTYSQGHRARPRTSIGELSSGADTDKRRSRAEKKSSDHPRQSVDYDSGSVSEAPSPFRDPKPPSPPPSSTSNNHRPTLSPDASSHGKPLPTDQVLPEEPKGPSLTLSEGLLWKQNKKSGHLLPLSGAESFACLNQRDHIFVIDNSESMRAHRKDVVEVVSLLAYMLKGLDPDGLDIYFTQSTNKVQSGRSTKLSKAVDQVPFHGISDMRMRLSSIFHKHQNLGTPTNPPGPWYKRAAPPKAKTGVSFYIFTDGKYQPNNDVGSTIKAIVDYMKEHKLPKEHVGIQFIRFGEDPDGIDHLNHLDHGLGLKDIHMDIVDTTFWKDNVWKQLLGAVTTWYNDDPE